MQSQKTDRIYKKMSDSVFNYFNNKTQIIVSVKYSFIMTLKH